MSGLPWYPRYVGDYARKTKQLSMLEHGAYNLLLDHYYATGLPLLNTDKHSLSNAQADLLAMPDHSRLYRLCGAFSKAEQEAVDHILKTFFEWTDEGYVNSKAEETLEKQHEAHAKRVNAGRKGGKKSRKHSLSNAKAKPKQPEPEPEPIKKYNKKDFDSFFEAYPKKVEPHEAEEAFREQVEEGEDPNVIIEAARQYASEQDGNDKKFIKNPATFLDKKVFLSPEYQKEKPKPVDISKFPDWKKKLCEDIGVAHVVSWFGKAELDGKVIYVETKFIQNWIENNYKTAIERIGVNAVRIKKS